MGLEWDDTATVILYNWNAYDYFFGDAVDEY